MHLRELEIVNAAQYQYRGYRNKSYLYNRLQRKGSTARTYTVLQHENRHVFRRIDAGTWA